jgi:hypothetical protein
VGLLKDDEETKADASRERIISTTLELVNIDDLTLRQMIDFRRSEEVKSGTALRDLRHRYLNRIDEHLKGLRDATLTQTDIERKREEFEDDMKDDLRAIKEALKWEGAITLLSKDVVVALSTPLIAAASVLAGATFQIDNALTAASTPVILGGILAARTKYQQSRSKLMRDHPMAYLYELHRNT